jgi:putative membrane protein
MTVPLAAWIVTLAAALAALGALAQAGRWPRRRLAAGAGGLLVAGGALSPPAEAACTHSLTAHMLAHGALVCVAAPLLALALPPPGRMGGRRLAAAWAALAACQWIVYLGGVLPRSLAHDPLHGLVMAVLLGTALAFWRAVLAPDERPARRVAALLLAMPAGDAVAVWLMAADGPRYAHLALTEGRAAALADQRRAAAVMLAGSLVLAAAALSLAWRAILAEDRDAERVEGAL